jgi:hypothetical protein
MAAAWPEKSECNGGKKSFPHGAQFEELEPECMRRGPVGRGA